MYEEIIKSFPDNESKQAFIRSISGSSCKNCNYLGVIKTLDTEPGLHPYCKHDATKITSPRCFCPHMRARL